MSERPRSDHRVIASSRGLAHRFVYVGLVLTAFALMLLGKADALLMERFRAQVTDSLAPVLDVVSRPVASAGRLIESARELAALHEENERLRRDRARLLQWQDVARRLEAENKALKAQLKFVPPPAAGFVSARVVADTGGAFAHSLLINAGTGDGVRKGQAVVTGDGLVGRIAGVASRSARILLITDLNSRIPVLVEPSRIRAILAGDNSDRPRIIHTPPGAMISPGDRVVTSGHGGAFPAGLAVGHVTSVAEGVVVVEPFVERSRLEYVRVVDFGLTGILQVPSTPVPAAAATGSEAGQ